MANLFKFYINLIMKILKWLFLVCSCMFSLTTVSACQPSDVPIGGDYRPVKTEYAPGDQVCLTCDPGLLMMGQMKRSCKQDGKWTGTTPFCDQSVKVKNPGGDGSWRYPQWAVDNNTQTCAITSRNTGQHFTVYLAEAAIINMIRLFLPQCTVKYNIIIGHYHDPRKCNILERTLEKNQWVEVTCEEPLHSSWVHIRNVDSKGSEMTICELEIYARSDVWCTDPPNILVQNGFLRVSRSKAILECTEGFRPGKFHRLVCDKEDWVGKGILQCEEILCDASVNTVKSGVWKLIGNKLSIGSKKRLVCASTHQVSGTPNIIDCLPNGTWTKSTAMCEERNSSGSLHQYKPTFIAIFSIIVIIIMACLVVIIILLYKKNRAQPVVVVVKKEDVDNARIYSEAEYAAITYDTIRTLTSMSSPYPPLPPSRPPVALSGEYSRPLDRDCPPRYVSSPSYTEPFDKSMAIESTEDATFEKNIDLEFVKVSPLYGEPD